VCIMCWEVYSVYTVLGSLVRVYCVEKASVFYCVGESSVCTLCGEV